MQTKPRILIVDDDANVLTLMQQILNGAGFDSELAAGGREAIKKLETNRPDLVTLDLIMPDVDGWGVLAHLRRVPAPPPVLVVTGHPESVGPFSVMASVAAYIVKPFSAAELVTTCQKVVAARAPKPPGLEDRRSDSRRMFVVPAQIVSPAGEALGSGHVVEVSPRGVRFDTTVPLTPGQEVDVMFRLPGNKEPIRARSLVRWSKDSTAGLQLLDLSPEDAQRLAEIVKPLGSLPR